MYAAIEVSADNIWGYLRERIPVEHDNKVISKLRTKRNKIKESNLRKKVSVPGI